MAHAEPGSAPFTGTRIATLTELDARLAAAADPEEFWFDMPIDPSLDPLSPAYRDIVHAYYRSLAGEARPLSASAGMPPDRPGGFRPSPFSTGDGAQVGVWLQAAGFIMAVCRLRRGHRVLQVEAGEGGLALMLAQLGCSVTALDAEQRHVDAIRTQAGRAGLALRALHAGFDAAGAAVAGQRFDFVIFHSALHRSHDHVALLPLVREQLLAKGGRLVLAGEPLLEALPVPWGLNPAGAAVSAMRRGGAPSLVFRPSHLLHTLSSFGYTSELSVCPQSAMGNVIIARRCTIESGIQ